MGKHRTGLLRISAAARQGVCNFSLITRNHEDEPKTRGELLGRDLHERPDGIQAQHHFLCREPIQIVDEDNEPLTANRLIEQSRCWLFELLQLLQQHLLVLLCACAG